MEGGHVDCSVKLVKITEKIIQLSGREQEIQSNQYQLSRIILKFKYNLNQKAEEIPGSGTWNWNGLSGSSEWLTLRRVLWSTKSQ